MNFIGGLIALLCLSACASKPLSEGERSVRILRKSDAPASCKELGKVHAPGAASITEQGREDDLKRATFALGGNTVTIDRADENLTIYGTAFRCNTSTQ